jgi:lipoate-protein ligase A
MSINVYRNNNTDAAYNLALEDRIFEEYKDDDEFFMLWRNASSVIVGNNQVIENEVDTEYAKQHNIKIVRRKTGGGAVYHDLGNVNYTYISKKVSEFGNFLVFAQPVIDFLKTRGVDARHIGKNDIGIFDGTIDRKISGTAQRVKDEHILHHGTLMFDVNVDTLEKVLTPDPTKLTEKGIKSIRSRVTNISEYLPITREEFWQEICTHFGANKDIKTYW